MNPHDRSPYVLKEENDVLWLKPGVHRTVPTQLFEALFGNYDTVIRATRPVLIDTVAYARGDAIVATRIDNEEAAYGVLHDKGVPADALVASIGAKRGSSSVEAQ